MVRSEANRRLLVLGGLVAAHFAVAVLAVQTVVDLLGLQELSIVCPVVVGLLWGQAILLGQFLALGTRWPLLRILFAAAWFAAVVYLAQPFFAATGGQDALFGCCVFLAMPFGSSFLLSAARRGGGLRITTYHDERAHDERLRFSLRQLFALILLAAVTLAGLRLARDSVEETSRALLFGLLPALEVCVVLPPISLWAVLGNKHVAWRSASLISLGLASVVGPLFIGRAKPQTYWMLVWPVVLPSVIVVGSLFILRAIGYRYVDDWLISCGPRAQQSDQGGG